MSTPNHAAPNQVSWFDRFIDRIYHANMSRAATQLRVEAHTQYQAMITDLDATLDPTFEGMVADSMKRRELVDFRPSHVLFPRMMTQFGVAKPQCTDVELKALGKQCDHCEHISQCWQALRGKAGAEECRQFCPNAEALIVKTQ